MKYDAYDIETLIKEIMESDNDVWSKLEKIYNLLIEYFEEI